MRWNHVEVVFTSRANLKYPLYWSIGLAIMTLGCLLSDFTAVLPEKVCHHIHESVKIQSIYPAQFICQSL